MAKANCNWWQYARSLRNVGRTAKMLPYTDDERAAIATFLEAIRESRPFLTQKLNLAFDNPLAPRNGEETAPVAKPQNDASRGEALERAAKSFKADPPTEDEKAALDALFEATGDRKDRVVALPGEADGGEGGEGGSEGGGEGGEGKAEGNGGEGGEGGNNTPAPEPTPEPTPEPEVDEHNFRIYAVLKDGDWQRYGLEPDAETTHYCDGPWQNTRSSLVNGGSNEWDEEIDSVNGWIPYDPAIDPVTAG